MSGDFETSFPQRWPLQHRPVEIPSIKRLAAITFLSPFPYAQNQQLPKDSSFRLPSTCKFSKSVFKPAFSLDLHASSPHLPFMAELVWKVMRKAASRWLFVIEPVCWSLLTYNLFHRSLQWFDVKPQSPNTLFTAFIWWAAKKSTVA